MLLECVADVLLNFCSTVVRARTLAWASVLKYADSCIAVFEFAAAMTRSGSFSGARSSGSSTSPSSSGSGAARCITSNAIVDVRRRGIQKVASQLRAHTSKAHTLSAPAKAAAIVPWSVIVRAYHAARCALKAPGSYTDGPVAVHLSLARFVLILAYLVDRGADRVAVITQLTLNWNVVWRPHPPGAGSSSSSSHNNGQKRNDDAQCRLYLLADHEHTPHKVRSHCLAIATIVQLYIYIAAASRRQPACMHHRPHDYLARAPHALLLFSGER